MTGALRIACKVAGHFASGIAAAGVIAGCGGAGNPVDNPDSVKNPGGSVAGQKLSFAYFQYCVNPVFKKSLVININGNLSTNTCAAGGCHDSVSGTGGALRLVGAAANVADPVTEAPDVIRAQDIYKNYYSAQGSVVVGSADLSNLLNKPLVRKGLHGGGLIFLNEQDANVKLMTYWITHPVPKSKDEFSSTLNEVFDNGDPATGKCLTTP